MHAHGHVGHRARGRIPARAACAENFRRGNRANPVRRARRPRPFPVARQARSNPAREIHIAADKRGGVLRVDRFAAGKRRGIRAHLRAALHGGMAANRHQPAFVAAHPAAQQTEIQNHRHRVAAERVLRDAHAPDQHGGLARRESIRQIPAWPRGSSRTAASSSSIGQSPIADFKSSKPAVWLRMKFSSTQLFSIRIFSTPPRNAMSPPVETGKPIVRDVRAEQRALETSTAPNSAPCPARDTD